MHATAQDLACQGRSVAFILEGSLIKFGYPRSALVFRFRSLVSWRVDPALRRCARRYVVSDQGESVRAPFATVSAVAILEAWTGKVNFCHRIKMQ